MGNAGGKSPKAKLDRSVDGVWYMVEFEAEPFGEGQCRYAFKGVYVGKGPLNGKECVAKVFIDEAGRHYRNYVPDINVSLKANELAKAFNAQYSSSKPLRFIVPQLATVTEVPYGNVYAEVNDKILVEDFIEGKYEKFNTNGGWESDSVTAVPAFSHYTYWKTGGELLVCDIQGVRTPTGYILTDPAVLSRKEGQFGPTDGGPSFMARFFRAHQCNSVCSEFPKPETSTKKVKFNKRTPKNTAYTFMLSTEEQQANEYHKGRKDLPVIVEE